VFSLSFGCPRAVPNATSGSVLHCCGLHRCEFKVICSHASALTDMDCNASLCR